MEPISLYCAPIYAGIYSYVNKLKKLEHKAKNTVSLTNHDNIERKIKIRTATEVFKSLNGRNEQKRHCNKFRLFQSFHWYKRQWKSTCYT